MKLYFEKYQATGNDFIMLDFFNKKKVNLSTKQIALMCDRRFGIGADGLIMIIKHKNLDFEMLYYNADGKIGSMCGNGGRCSAMFAIQKGFSDKKTNFKAFDGVHNGELIKKDIIKLSMADVSEVKKLKSCFEIDTGSPHYIKFLNNVSDIDVFSLGKKIRYSDKYKSQGINVNFVEIKNRGVLSVRTYERGVENETLSCGTGVTASAIAYMETQKITALKMQIKTPGGNLVVEAKKNNNNTYSNVFLTGKAEKTFEGYINI